MIATEKSKGGRAHDHTVAFVRIASRRIGLVLFNVHGNVLGMGRRTVGTR